ncbi:MAG: SseB family protein [Microbacteriaceae bacterium]
MSHDHSHPGGAERFARSHDPLHTDSAGNSWEGRTFHENPYAGDDGTTPAAVAEALVTFRQSGGSIRGVIAALHETRLLIPLVAHAGDDFDPEAPIMEDKVQELAVVTVAGPDGRPVIPAFTSAAAMKSWNSEARPIPMDAQRVALAAASEGVDRIVLNATTDEELMIRRPALWALAQGQEWIPAWEDADLQRHLDKLVSKIRGVVKVTLEPADAEGRGFTPELRVVLHLVAGLSQEDLSVLVTKLNEVLTGSTTLQMAADSIELKLALAL